MSATIFGARYCLPPCHFKGSVNLAMLGILLKLTIWFVLVIDLTSLAVRDDRTAVEACNGCSAPGPLRRSEVPMRMFLAPHGCPHFSSFPNGHAVPGRQGN